jgi:GNAT superfamily N-acetyltransferase
LIALGHERDLFFVQLVRAHPSDASTLSTIAWASKANWGYPAHWMEQWRKQLTITPQFIATNETFATLRDGRLIAFHALLEAAETFRLEHLWVLPEHVGQGIGRLLFTHAAGRAAARGGCSLTIEADPNAEPFYRHMGAVRVGVLAGEIDGQRRELPLLTFDLNCNRGR